MLVFANGERKLEVPFSGEFLPGGLPRSHLTAGFDLPPGQYNIKVVIRNPGFMAEDHRSIRLAEGQEVRLKVGAARKPDRVILTPLR